MPSQTPKISFASDNYAGVHPKVMNALQEANIGHQPAYGYDIYTKRLQKIMKHHLGDVAECWPVWNGTGANVLALQAMMPRWGAVICVDTSHLNTDENGAPQITGGLKLWLVPSENGKLTPELIDRQAWGFGVEHRAQPMVVSISQTTELGTSYSVDEIKAIADHCHHLGMKLHVDGARIANAAAYLDVSLATLLTDSGVDVVSFGGTKNGMMYGECIVGLQPNALPGMVHLRKINLQLASKMRFISAQFIALLENNLWLENARHANAMAQYLSDGLNKLPFAKICYPVQSNAVFAKLPHEAVARARKLFSFYDWDNDGTVRLMCSFDTQKHHIDRLLDSLKSEK